MGKYLRLTIFGVIAFVAIMAFLVYFTGLYLPTPHGQPVGGY